MPYRDRAKQREYQRKRALVVRESFHRMKEGLPCTDCGNFFAPHIMEWDHVPERGVKLFNVSNFGTSVLSNKRLQDEIAKCDLVCANCHNTRTWKRKQVCESVPESRLSTQES